MAAAAVAVEVDALLGSAKCALAEVAGVELSVAPLRPPNVHTVERQAVFVPYGEQVRVYFPIIFIEFWHSALCLPLCAALTLDVPTVGSKGSPRCALTEPSL
jgi:hypothetical protein